VQQDDVVRHHQSATLLVPASAVAGYNGDSILCDLRADFCQMKIHHFGICGRRYHCGADPARRADGAD
jgi:hypothetical protein